MNLPLQIAEEIFTYLPLNLALKLSNWSALEIYDPLTHSYPKLIQTHDLDVLNWLLTNGHELENMDYCCEFGTIEILKLYRFEKYCGQSLEICACSGQCEMAGYLVEMGIKSDAVVDLASAGGNIEILTMLLQHGYQFGALAINNAVRNGHTSALELLHGYLRQRLDGRESGGELGRFEPSVQALSMASKNGHLKLLEYCFNHCTFPKPTIQTILEFAAEGGQLEIVKMIISRFGREDRFEMKYCLGFARLNQHMDVVEYLLSL